MTPYATKLHSGRATIQMSSYDLHSETFSLKNFPFFLPNLLLGLKSDLCGFCPITSKINFLLKVIRQTNLLGFLCEGFGRNYLLSTKLQLL